MKKIILIFFFICFAGSSFSQEEDELDIYDLFEEPEEIACEDLPETFKKYNEDRSLNQKAMERSLTNTVQTLKEIAEFETPSSKERLVELVENLEQAVSLSQSNEFIFLNKADNISYFLKDCASKKTESAVEAGGSK